MTLKGGDTYEYVLESNRVCSGYIYALQSDGDIHPYACLWRRIIPISVFTPLSADVSIHGSWGTFWKEEEWACPLAC